MKSPWFILAVLFGCYIITHEGALGHFAAYATRQLVDMAWQVAPGLLILAVLAGLLKRIF